MYWRDSSSLMSNSMQEMCCLCSDNANCHDPMPERIIPLLVMRTGSGGSWNFRRATSLRSSMSVQPISFRALCGLSCSRKRVTGRLSLQPFAISLGKGSKPSRAGECVLSKCTDLTRDEPMNSLSSVSESRSLHEFSLWFSTTIPQQKSVLSSLYGSRPCAASLLSC